jgi:type IV pilus assembly protein PilP
MPRAFVAACLLLALVGCGEDEEIHVGRGMQIPGGGAPAAGGAAAGPAGEETGTADAGVPALVLRDEDFAEADSNRDPFRNFAAAFTSRPTRVDSVQRSVVMPRTAIEDMTLIAIVSGVATPSAMIVDRDGTGYPVRRGDFIGRAEVVQTGSEDAVPITLNWRVDRIRPGEVVLMREDPTAPNRPPLTRIIALHEEDASNPGSP